MACFFSLHVGGCAKETLQTCLRALALGLLELFYSRRDAVHIESLFFDEELDEAALVGFLPFELRCEK